VHGDDAERPAYEFPDEDTDAGSVFRYEVSLRVDGDAELAALLERAWRALGDEVRVDGDSGGAVGAVCTDDIGAVVEAALALGRPSGIMVRDRRG
jgi:hypothetical protein